MKKLFSVVFVILGVFLGLYFSFLLISRLLLSQNIVLSFGPGQTEASKEDENQDDFSRYAARNRHPVRHNRSSRVNIDAITNIEELRKLAMESLENQDYSYAGEIFRRIGKLRPDFPDLNWYIGKCEEGDENAAAEKMLFSSLRRKMGEIRQSFSI